MVKAQCGIGEGVDGAYVGSRVVTSFDWPLKDHESFSQHDRAGRPGPAT